jgi:DedD protein
MAGNRPAREKFDFSLDARQVAGVILGSLGALGLAFFLGHSVGQSVAERPAASPRPPVKAPPPANSLEVFDKPPSPDGGEPAYKDTFHESLTSPRPPPDRLPPSPKVQAPPAPVPAPIKAQAPVAAAPAKPAPAADVAPTGSAAPVEAGAGKGAAATAPAPATPSVAAPAAAPAVAPSAAPKASPPPRPAAPVKAGWVVQVGSTQERFEAERIAARFASRGARVSVADVPGKGRWYRVRLGSFDTREAADRYLRDLEKATGAKGFVASAN